MNPEYDLRDVDPDTFLIASLCEGSPDEPSGQTAPQLFVWSNAHGRFVRANEIGTWRVEARRGESSRQRFDRMRLFELDAANAVFAADGSVRVRTNGSAGTARLCGIYLLAGYRELAPQRLTVVDLRALALCYREGELPGECVMGLDTHEATCALAAVRPDAGGASREGTGRPVQIDLNREPFLLQEGVSLDVDGTPIAVTRTGEAEAVVLTGRDAAGNEIRARLERRGDRVGCVMRYEVTTPVDRDVEVALAIHPRSPVRRLETLHWSTRHDRLAVQQPEDESPILFCQYPFVLARLEDEAWLGVFDPDLSNIFLSCGGAGSADGMRAAGGTRARGGARSIRVAQAFWPDEPRTYEWSFELLPGYGSYANAMLRAAYPYTKDNRPVTDGFMAYGPIIDPQTAATNHVRVVYRHGWPYRNGVYCGEFKWDERYVNFWEQEFSYAEFAREIARCREAGIRVLPYTQFTGVSDDVTDRFARALIRDLDGAEQVVGRDGRYRNIWANPDPDREYGSSFLRQVDAILAELGAGGIAMDRTDRFDNRMKRGLFDLSHNDGYASVHEHGGARRPCSPIAVQGKRLLLRLRGLLDRHGGLYVANIPRAFLVYRLADGVKGDVPHTPWALFFLKALSNGKCLFMHDRLPVAGQQFSHDRRWTDSQIFLARLWRAHAVISPRHEVERDWTPSRLLYVVPDGADYPRTLVFADGQSTIEFDYSVFDGGMQEIGPFNGEVGPPGWTVRTYPGMSEDRYRGSTTTIRRSSNDGES